ncbi:MAG TPA: efflux RND transporter periplasmic adaptor subunit [Limnochordia bacterium]|nr:efflux RND transporter periplasmic adaptor subunit [Limnochordia bacterium]
MSKKRRWIILGLIVVVGLAGAFYVVLSRDRSPATLVEGPRASMQSAMPIGRGTISRAIESSGTISGARQADLGFTSGGKLEDIFVEVGQLVAAGEILAQIESAQQELALLRAENASGLAQIGGTTNARREAELDLEVARANLENTSIKAPFAGIVTAVAFEAGEHISANTSVVSLLDHSVFYADIAVDELDMYQIQLGQGATVKVDALGGLPLDGTVSRIGMIAQSSGGITTVPVTIRIESEPGELRVGYSASVVIEVERAEDVFIVPVEAVVRQGNRSFVTVLRAGETETVEVVTGITDGMQVEISSGLEPTDQIVGFNSALYGTMRSQPGGGPTIRIGGFGG